MPLQSHDLAAHKARVLAVGAAPDGRRVLSVASDGTLAETPIAKGAAGRTRRVELGPAPTRAAVFSPDGARLITGGEFGDVRVYDVESGRLRQTLRGHRNEIQDLAVRPQSMTLASAGADADIRVWDGATGRQTAVVDGDLSAFAVAFSPRDGMLASGGSDRRATLSNPGTFAPVGVFALAAPKMVATLAWSPDGRWLAIGDIDDLTLSKGGLQVIDASSRALVATLATGDVPAEPGRLLRRRRAPRRGHGARAARVASHSRPLSGTIARIPWRTWQPKLLESLAGYDRRTFTSDVVAGVTVGVVDDLIDWAGSPTTDIIDSDNRRR